MKLGPGIFCYLQPLLRDTNEDIVLIHYNFRYCTQFLPMELIFKYFDRLDIAWYFQIQGGKNDILQRCRVCNAAWSIQYI